MRKFKLHWLGGKTEKIEGEGIADAFRRAGYSLGVLKVLDYWEEVSDENDEAASEEGR